jgi:hypothetical protein
MLDGCFSHFRRVLVLKPGTVEKRHSGKLIGSVTQNVIFVISQDCHRTERPFVRCS